MVTDRLENAGLYFGLGKAIEVGLRFLKTDQVYELPAGRHDVDDQVFALTSEYVTKPRNSCEFESHRKYIDIQLIVEGCECIDYASRVSLSKTQKYDSAGDVSLYSGEGSEIKLEPGCFAIFFPDDAHRPQITDTIAMPVRKVVVKVPVESS